jgi:endoglucanase
MPMVNAPRGRTRPKARWIAWAIAVLGSPLIADPGRACPQLSHNVPANVIQALSRGVNLDGWISTKGSTAPSTALLRELRNAGMTHIRLPVPAERVMRRFASGAERDEQLRLIDRALRELTSLGYHVSLDLHPGDRFNRLHREEPEASLQELKDAWADLARIIRPYPADKIFAELLNEPDVDADRWQTEAQQLAGFVRALLPHATLIVGPVNWQRADSLPGFVPLDDLNVVYAIHMYDPMAFTHQGHWDAQEPLSGIRGLPYPIRAEDPRVRTLRRQLLEQQQTPALAALDKAIIASSDADGIVKWLEPAEAWQRRFLRPIIINEFGVLKSQAPRESRLRWLAAVATYANQHCWGWAHWELAQGFGLVDDKTGQADPGVMKALLGRH